MHNSFFLLFLHASYLFPPLYSVLTAPFLQHGFLYGLQALQCSICSSVAHLQATAPLGVSLLQHGSCIGISLLWHGSPLGCSTLRGICLCHEAPPSKSTLAVTPTVSPSMSPPLPPFSPNTSSGLLASPCISSHLSFFMALGLFSCPQQLLPFLKHT